MTASDALQAAARAVLAANRRQGRSAWGDREYDFVCPSGAAYPFQWFWDSCFHAIALTHVDPNLAEQELRGLFQAAQPSGFIPHMILWERAAHEAVLATYNVSFGAEFTTATIQPPVLAQAVERVWLAGANPTFLEEALPVVQAYHAWLAANRDPTVAG